jgi:hypothetical protein
MPKVDIEEVIAYFENLLEKEPPPPAPKAEGGEPLPAYTRHVVYVPVVDPTGQQDATGAIQATVNAAARERSSGTGEGNGCPECMGKEWTWVSRNGEQWRSRCPVCSVGTRHNRPVGASDAYAPDKIAPLAREALRRLSKLRETAVSEVVSASWHASCDDLGCELARLEIMGEQAEAGRASLAAELAEKDRRIAAAVSHVHQRLASGGYGSEEEARLGSLVLAIPVELRPGGKGD